MIEAVLTLLAPISLHLPGRFLREGDLPVPQFFPGFRLKEVLWEAYVEGQGFEIFGLKTR